jgi:hypothetical protein
MVVCHRNFSSIPMDTTQRKGSNQSTCCSLFAVTFFGHGENSCNCAVVSIVQVEVGSCFARSVYTCAMFVIVQVRPFAI